MRMFLCLKAFLGIGNSHWCTHLARVLNNLIKSVIAECHKIGLIVIATVCDQGGPNQAAVNLLLKETREHQLRNSEDPEKKFGFLVNGVEVVPLFVPPHLFKGLRNNLLNKDLHFKLDDKQLIAKWKHLEQFYLLDTEDDHRICNKLTDQHIFAQKINKMKVICCTQVFSNQVGSLMKRIISWSNYIFFI